LKLLEYDAKGVQPLEFLLHNVQQHHLLLIVIRVFIALMESQAEKSKPGVTMAKGPRGSNRH